MTVSVKANVWGIRVLGISRRGPKTGFEEIHGHVLEPDLPGVGCFRCVGDTT